MRDLRWVDPWRLLRGRSPFLISEAMRIVVDRYGDFDKIRDHPTELLVSTTEWDTGKNRLFSTREPGLASLISTMPSPPKPRSPERPRSRGAEICAKSFAAMVPVTRRVRFRSPRVALAVRTAVGAPAAGASVLLCRESQ